MYDIQGVYFSPPDRKAKVNFFVDTLYIHMFPNSMKTFTSHLFTM